jgi:hypothetical protein
MTAAEADAGRITELALECGISVIGRMGGEGIRLAAPSGEERPLDAAGYEHEW